MKIVLDKYYGTLYVRKYGQGPRISFYLIRSKGGKFPSSSGHFFSQMKGNLCFAIYNGYV